MDIFRHPRIVIVDTETSGLSHLHNRIIEVAILRIEYGVCVGRFESLVNPEVPVTPWILSLTGIKASELERAPTFTEIAPRVHEALSGALFIAHNARFDYAFLKQEFKRVGMRFNAKCLCTVRLSRLLDPTARQHDLESIIDRYGFKPATRHRAFSDAEVLWDFLNHHRNRDEETLNERVDLIVRKPSTPPRLPPDALENLPHGPGVYIFYDEDGNPLYVGKSKHLSERVAAHFSASQEETKELLIAEHVARIETHETASELSALLLESSLVKKMQPLYNRQLRRKKTLVLARRIGIDRYHSAHIERIDRIRPDEHADILGVFRSIRQAQEYFDRQAKEYALCKKLLGLEKAKHACFGFQLGRCRGACLGKEAPEEYNIRFEKAFDERKLVTWPYAGPIMIQEGHPSGVGDTFVVDQWCLLGGRSPVLHLDETRIAEPDFDHDTYRILASYILDPGHQKNIAVMTTEQFNEFFNRT